VRIRPLHIALIAVGAGAVYSTVSVVASFAELRSVGDRVAAAAQRSRPASTALPVAAARGQEPSAEEIALPGAVDAADRQVEAREPSTAAERSDVDPEQIDDDTAAEEQRYIENAGAHDDSARSELDDAGAVSALPGPPEEDPAIVIDDPALGDASDGNGDAGTETPDRS
jgi:hypothetical protein